MPKKENIIGCLIGCMVGDSIGLAFENLKQTRQEKIFGNELKQCFLFNKGMVSDDTEHLCIAAQSLIAASGETNRFKKQLAWRMKFWILGMPAGIGLATLKSILKLWMFFPPDKSGVYSAGNGPAMRSPILGVCLGDNPDKLKEFNKISTRITHTDPKAEYGALAVASASYLASISEEGKVTKEEFKRYLEQLIPEDEEEFNELINKVYNSIDKGESTQDFVNSMSLKKGITGYMYHTMPAVIHCWLKNQNDYKSAITEIIRCGGDTDTTAAILGGIIGSGISEEEIPESWRENIFEWPKDIKWVRKLGGALHHAIEGKEDIRPLPELPILCIFRNTLFFIAVLVHVLRRMFPPY